MSGLAEVFTSQVGYDTVTSTLIIAYTNSNIDLIQNGKITNLPYLKNANIAGDKNVYNIFCVNGIAYDNCSLNLAYSESPSIFCNRGSITGNCRDLHL